MVWSDTSTNQGIVQDIDFLCGTSATSYPLNDKARNANRHYYKAIIAALRASGRFQFDDSNLGSLPIVTANLTDSTNEVKLEGSSGSILTYLKIDAIEVKDASGKWHRLQEIDVADLQETITDFESTDGVPKYYDTIGNYVYLFPAPAASQMTLTNGIKFFIQREVDTFTNADTTQEPGIAEPFHRILSLGAAHDYLLVNGPMERADRVMQEYSGLLLDLKEFYSDKNRDSKVRVRPSTRTVDYT